MQMLIDLNSSFVIRQDSGREVPLNDLDCCLITIQEKKILKNKSEKPFVILPFANMKVNLYNYTILNKLKETRLILKSKIKKRAEDNFKVEESKEYAK